MTRSHMGYLMCHDGRQLRLALSGQYQPAVHVEESARQGERIDLVAVDDLDGERHPRIRVAYQILADTIHVGVDFRISHELRSCFYLLRQVLTNRNLALQRVKVQPGSNVAMSDEVDVVLVRLVRRRSGNRR